jgi:hypothetical protein
VAQIFHPSTNTLSRASLFGAVFIAAGLAWAAAQINRSPYLTQADVARAQPVPFSHKHHVGGVGIDCRFCHTTVEETAFAGLPSTKVCMGCHSQLWADSPTLAPLHESFRTDRSIEWTRVHDVPDFVYFDHSIHVKRGVGCASCHGRVDQMPLMWRTATLQMEWCLDCHRHPERHLRPREEVFNMDWRADDQEAFGRELAARYGVRPLTHCSICHR